MSVEKTVFGTLSDGREAALYTLKNAAGMTLVVTPYGCRIIQLLVPDKDGNLGDVVLGYAYCAAEAAALTLPTPQCMA